MLFLKYLLLRRKHARCFSSARSTESLVESLVFALGESIAIGCPLMSSLGGTRTCGGPAMLDLSVPPVADSRLQKRDMGHARGRRVSVEEPQETATGRCYCRRYRALSEVVKLVKSNDGEATPIARYIPYTRHFFVLLMDRHAALEVKDEAMGYMDHLIGPSFPFFCDFMTLIAEFSQLPSCREEASGCSPEGESRTLMRSSA